MKTRLIFFLFVTLSFLSFSQTDTVRIQKIDYAIFHCTDVIASDWYLIRENNDEYILINVELPESEIDEWYQKFKNSQNFYRATLHVNTGVNILNFKKLDQLDDQIRFELISSISNYLELMPFNSKEVYGFQLINEK